MRPIAQQVAPANMKAIQDYLGKGLMTGVANSIAIPILFGGSEMTTASIPFLGYFNVPDLAIFFSSGALGQIASDFVHGYLFPLSSQASKMQNATSTLASLAAYNAVQIPIVGYVGGVSDGRLAQYCAISSLVHYGVERVYHDVLGQ